MHGNGGRPAITRILVPLCATHSGNTGAPPHGSASLPLPPSPHSRRSYRSPAPAHQSFSPDPVRSVDLLLPLTGSAQSPAALQAESIAQLLALLVVIAAAACAVAVVTALTIQWTRSGARDIDTAVRRAVGASRRDLALSFLGEGDRHRPRPRCRWVSASATSPSGSRCVPGRKPSAPGTTSPRRSRSPRRLVLLLGALLPLRFARGKRLVNLPANPLSLFPPGHPGRCEPRDPPRRDAGQQAGGAAHGRRERCRRWHRLPAGRRQHRSRRCARPGTSTCCATWPRPRASTR